MEKKGIFFGARVFLIAIVAFSMFGCSGLLKKNCGSSDCMQAALLNDCEEAVHQSELLGRIVKSEISRVGDKCVYVSGLYSNSGEKLSESTCTYQRPVIEGTGDCDYWDYRFSS